METHLPILKALANGSDPITGEMLPSTSPYNHPQVIRTLFATIHYLQNPPKRPPKANKTVGQKQAENLEHGLPQNAGLPWQQEQRQSLGEQFQQGATIEALAQEYQRTKGAITAELKRQGLIEE